MPREFISNDWFTVSLIILGFGLLLLKQSNSVKYLQFAKLPFSSEYLRGKTKESRLFTGFEIILFTLPHLILAQLLFYYFHNMHIIRVLGFSSLLLVFILFVALCLFSFLKYQVEKFINKCMTNSSFINFYLFFKQVIFSYTTFLSLPFLIISVYSSSNDTYFYLISSIVIGLFFILRILLFFYQNRSVLIGSWYYFILYLCTLEIAPYFFLYKIFAVE